MTDGQRGSQAAGHPSADTLVIQTAFLGDVVLTTPLLSALAERHGPVDLITTPAAAVLVETHPAVREVIRYDKRRRDAGWRGFFRLAGRLRRRRYARVYLPHRSWRSAALALAAGIKSRIGFADSPAAITYTARMPRARGGHEVERLLGLAGGGSNPVVSLGLTSDDQALADEWLSLNGFNAGFVALAPGSIWGTKRWPYYPELVRALDAPIVVVGGAEDAELAEAVIAAAPDRVRSAAGALGLRGSAALLRRAAVLVTNDSAPLHLGTAAGVPVVAVFGPTVPEFGFGPRDSRSRALGHPSLPCRPCSAHGPQVCPLQHHRCMRELAVETVLAAVSSALGAEEMRASRSGH
jgi:heptosyltransferase II